MGGKSRKTGGVSKALINKIKAGKFNKTNCNKKPKSNGQKSIFEED